LTNAHRTTSRREQSKNLFLVNVDFANGSLIRREKERAKEREEAWLKVHQLARQNYPDLSMDDVGTLEFEPVMGDIPENDEMNYEKIEMASREVSAFYRYVG
jgi:hypothetical protein